MAPVSNVKIFTSVQTVHINVVCNHVLITADMERSPPGMPITLLVLMSMTLQQLVAILVVVTIVNVHQDTNIISISLAVLMTNVLMLIIPFMVLTEIKIFVKPILVAFASILLETSTVHAQQDNSAQMSTLNSATKPMDILTQPHVPIKLVQNQTTFPLQVLQPVTMQLPEAPVIASEMLALVQMVTNVPLLVMPMVMVKLIPV
jgi:hypothetical protein